MQQEKDAAARKEQRRKERSAMASMDVQMEAAEARKAVRSVHWSARIAALPLLCRGMAALGSPATSALSAGTRHA
jgi:hypothetical protein